MGKRNGNSKAGRFRAKLRGGAIGCLCAAALIAAAGCGKKEETPGPDQPGDPTEITGDAAPADGSETQVGQNPETGSPQDNLAASGGPGEEPAKADGADGNHTGENGGKTDGEDSDPEGALGAGNSGDLTLFGTADEILACFRGQTLKYAFAMLSEDFSVCSAFSPELSGQLSEKDMKSAWKQALSGLRKPLAADGQEAENLQDADITAEASFLNPPVSGSESGSIADFGGFVITSAQVPYEGKNVILSISYGPTGAVEGIYLTYTLPEGKPEATEDYTEREVSVGQQDYPLAGILTLPNGVEKPPVVLLVHGSGQSDKNETVGASGSAPFADIAHGLAKCGIATLRYDKRYYTYPGLATETITIREEVLDDVEAALGLLFNTQEVDGERIFILGHSLGGMLAPCIVQENPQVAGMISLAGSPRGLWEIVYDQNMAAIQAAGLSEAEFSALEEMVQKEYDAVLSLVADVRDEKEEVSEEELSDVLFGVSGYYWESLAEIDSAAIARELSVPMLILQGDADFQVYPERDYAAWKVLLDGKENVTFCLFEGLNHLFMPSNGAMDVTEYDEEAHVAQEVIETIAQWLHSQPQ